MLKRTLFPLNFEKLKMFLKILLTRPHTLHVISIHFCAKWLLTSFISPIPSDTCLKEDTTYTNRTAWFRGIVWLLLPSTHWLFTFLCGTKKDLKTNSNHSQFRRMRFCTWGTFEMINFPNFVRDEEWCWDVLKCYWSSSLNNLYFYGLKLAPTSNEVLATLLHTNR